MRSLIRSLRPLVLVLPLACGQGEEGETEGCESSIDELISFCGDGTRVEGEACDDGNQIDGDGCDSLCVIEPGETPVCGDETVDEGETCDDGNQVDGDGCDASCMIEEESQALCGNGVVEPGEDCDDEGESADCDGDCTERACGDGLLNETAGEECDAEVLPTDDCTAECTIVEGPPVTLMFYVSGYGNVMSDPAGIQCGFAEGENTMCSAQFPMGTTVILEAMIVDAGSFTWSGDCADETNPSLLNLLMDEDKYCALTFE